MKTQNAFMNRIAWLVLLRYGLYVAGLALFLTAHAQIPAEGSVSGTVSNKATRTFLEGAEVEVVGAALRTLIVDSIPSDFIKEIELVKALTPDQAAVSIGGAANLVTKSALDFKEPVLTYRAGLNQNTFRENDRRWKPTGSLGYLTRLGKAQNVGLAFSSSYAESTNSRDRVQMTRNQIDGRNTQARILDDVATRTRGGLSMKVNGFAAQYEGFDWVTNRNYGSATIKGYELNYSQQLRTLPKPLNTLSIFMNYTQIETSGDYGSGSDELVRFIPKTANAGLSWRFARFEFRAAYNFKSGYLMTYNANPWQRQRTSGVETADFNLQYRLNPKFTVFLDVVNAFNRWESWYTGTDRGRVIMSEVYGTRLSAGVSGRF